MEPVALQDYICSLDPASLPRILKICSGVYFQSSIYELSGNECCLSTGDLIKVIQIHLKKVICENPETGHITELPPDFPGYFSSTINPQLYGTLDKLISAATRKGVLPIYFSSVHDLQVEDGVVFRDQPLRLMTVERYQGVRYACCMMDSGTHKFLPLPLQGTFYSWGPHFPKTLLQILQDPVLLYQPLICPTLHWNSLILQPEYEIDAIMHMRRNIVKIPSSLEVDVEDVTTSSEHLLQHFIRPLLLSEILAQGGPFPMRVRILEVPDGPPIFHRSLKKDQELMIHGPSSPPWRVLASNKSRKTPRHFFISGAYQGKLRRRPREFHTVFELLDALKPGFPLHVVATQDWESEEGDSISPSLFRGDRVEVLGKDKGPDGEVLVCNRMSDLTGEEEDEEEQSEEKEKLFLPLYFSCGFVEEMSDGKRYSLANLMTLVSLPCEVKVLGKDPSLSEDPLSSLLGLRLEEKITEPFLTISLCSDPRMSFEIPPRWLDLTVLVINEPLEKQGESLLISTVEELTDAFYYKLQSSQTCSAQAPPPRPPKNKQKCNSSVKVIAEATGVKEVTQVGRKQEEGPRQNLWMQDYIQEMRPKAGEVRKGAAKEPNRPPEPERKFSSLLHSFKSSPHLYSKVPKSCKVQKPPVKSPEQNESTDDSDHDYEEPEEQDLKEIIKKMEETILPYCDHSYEYGNNFNPKKPFR
ncbi:protein THEMIS2 [Macrotis lagotis]|uniref:protein THEMIS2 n=1 Tax=Macrotis lagotis TaxID=92651 RepID=UPI003D682546